MDSRVKQLWIDALEGGEYKQARETLRSDENHYCCLGVLCDLWAKDVGAGEWIKSAEGNRYNFTTGQMVQPDCSCGDCETWPDESETELPTAVMVWAGLSNPEGWFGEGVSIDGQNSLIGLNDNGKTFTEIAEVIKVQL